jgi:hypothetical protein
MKPRRHGSGLERHPGHPVRRSRAGMRPTRSLRQDRCRPLRPHQGSSYPETGRVRRIGPWPWQGQARAPQQRPLSIKRDAFDFLPVDCTSCPGAAAPGDAEATRPLRNRSGKAPQGQPLQESASAAQRHRTRACGDRA